MNKIDYNLGILERLVCGSVNGKPYVMLDDVEYIIRNAGILEEDNKSEEIVQTKNNIATWLDVRPANWPKHYDDLDVDDYHEWFIKGTNVKVACDYYDRAASEQQYYRLIGETYDTMEACENKEDLLADLEHILMNPDNSWQYYR